MSHEVWEEYYDRLADLVRAHRTTLVFVNTRRLAERVARHLSERLGEDAVTAHHGSLSKERRLDAERRLKGGQLKALVATASLELGIDIGHVDLVCQIGSPHRIATLLQRVGRSGHTVAGTPKGRVFPMSRDDLSRRWRCCAPSDADELDAVVSHDAPLDVLAQQIVAETACARVHGGRAVRARPSGLAVPHRSTGTRSTRAVAMVSEGFSTRRGRRGALVHRDEVNHRAARPARRADARAHLGRRHSRSRRLPRRRRAGRHVHRDAERGLRHRKHGGRHLPAGQRVVAGAPGGDGRDARRRRERARRRISRSGWARRRREATSCRARSATLRRGHRGAADAADVGRPTMQRDVVSAISRERPSAWLSRRNRRGRAAAEQAVELPGRNARDARRRARRRTRWCSSGSSTNRAACSSCCMRRSAAASTRRGGWRSESDSAGSSTSSCRPRRPTTRCCCRSARSIPFRSPTSSAICTRPRRRTSSCRRCSTRRVFQTRWRWNTTIAARGSRGSVADGRWRPSCSGCRPTI